MADRPKVVARIVRRGVKLQRAYLTSVARLTGEYVMALRNMMSDEQTEAATAPGTDRVTPDIVLEAGIGETATAAFLVQNHLREPISAPVNVSALTSLIGDTIHAGLHFEPNVVNLAPGERRLVHVRARIDERFVHPAGYYGFLSVPDLPGTELAILVRQLPVLDDRGENERRVSVPDPRPR